MRGTPFAALLVASCASRAAAPPTVANSTPASSSAAPDLAKLRALLEPYASSQFGKVSSDDRGCNVAPTIGEYVAQLVRYGRQGDAPVDTQWLRGGCAEHFDRPTGIDPPESPEYWQCIIDAFTSDPDGESPWHYELRVRIRKSDGALDIPTIACPGA